MFLTPLGGNVNHNDFVPCILFLILYATLLPAFIWNFFLRHQWSTVLIGTAAFSIERIVIFSLRLRQAAGLSSPTSTGLLIYQQITLGVGWFSLVGDAANLHRCLVVKTTIPDEEKGWDDQPRRRFRFRRYGDFIGLAFIAAVVPGVTAGSRYKNAPTNPADADSLRRLRLVSTIIAFVLLQIHGLVILYTYFKLDRVKKSAVLRLFSFYIAFMVISIYRFCVIFKTEDSILSTGPGTMTDVGSKAAFYVCHMLPEFLVASTQLVGRSRDVFSTGRIGDDATDHRLRRRLKKEAEEREREGQNFSLS